MDLPFDLWRDHGRTALMYAFYIEQGFVAGIDTGVRYFCGVKRPAACCTGGYRYTDTAFCIAGKFY